MEHSVRPHFVQIQPVKKNGQSCNVNSNKIIIIKHGIKAMYEALTLCFSAAAAMAAASASLLKDMSQDQ